MRHLILALVLLSLAGCAIIKKAEEPSIITGSSKAVSIRAGVWANPGPLAESHCARYDKETVLVGQQVLETGSTGSPRSYTYQFSCQ
jgi:hypothetical protein